MSEPVAIVSSVDITQDEFAVFLRQSGAVLNPDEIFHGRLSENDQHVWIALDKDSLEDWEEDEIKQITQKLGAEPRTHIVLEISDPPGSEQLAIKFACLFAERWPCVVDDLHGTIYSARELFDLRRSGRGFHEYDDHALADVSAV